MVLVCCTRLLLAIRTFIPFFSTDSTDSVIPSLFLLRLCLHRHHFVSSSTIFPRRFFLSHRTWQFPDTITNSPHPSLLVKRNIYIYIYTYISLVTFFLYTIKYGWGWDVYTIKEMRIIVANERINSMLFLFQFAVCGNTHWTCRQEGRDEGLHNAGTRQHVSVFFLFNLRIVYIYTPSQKWNSVNTFKWD